jgi:hypothetical protein
LNGKSCKGFKDMIYGATLRLTQQEARRNSQKISPIFIDNLELPPESPKEEKEIREYLDFLNKIQGR